MPTHLCRLGAVLALAVAGMVQAQPFQPHIAASAVEQDRYPQGRPVFPRGVTGLPGLVYATDPGYAPLRLDLYLPPGATATVSRPLVVFVHGGDWHGGSRRTNGTFADWPLALAALASRGYVVASIDYRLAPQASFPAQVQDVKDALRWLRSKAGTYGIDRSKVLVWGVAAGAHLAALAAVSCGAAGLDRPASGMRPNPAVGAGATPPPPSDESACVRAAVVWYGAYDLLPLKTMPQVNSFLGCTAANCDPQRRLASPVNYVDASVPPFLIVHGMEDTFFAVSQASALDRVIRARGGSDELVLLPGVGHAFIGASEDATRAATLRAWERTVDFIARLLPPARP